jgi:hypothetical protein
VHSSRKYKREIAQKLDVTTVSAVLTVGTERSFYDTLLEAIDEGFSSLGESVKVAIYFHLENTFRIKKREIPFRVDDFSDALEKLFGLGARHLEIIFMKNIHAKVRVKYKWDLPKWVVPELTFREYLRMVEKNLEADANEK